MTQSSVKIGRYSVSMYFDADTVNLTIGLGSSVIEVEPEHIIIVDGKQVTVAPVYHAPAAIPFSFTFDEAEQISLILRDAIKLRKMQNKAAQ